MAKINIQNGKISSSADYGLYHGTSEIATITAGGLKFHGDLTAENYIISSSVTYMTSSFSSGSTIFGNSMDDIHNITGSVYTTGSLTINTELSSSKALTVQGDISASGDLSVQGDITGSQLILDFDNMPTSDPGIKGAVYRHAGLGTVHVLRISEGS